MSKLGRMMLAMAIVLLGFAGANSVHADFSFSIGTDDFYLSVGDYDYLPYAFASHPTYVPPRISFYTVLSDYGYWVYVSPFGQVWRPYASYGWRPYVYGHWIYTQYGPTWEGYEPWAWAAYHYGNWIWTERFGWVWVPGYDWHPGRVTWSRGYDTIGWVPVPPPGYDYCHGYLHYHGSINQFTYYDDDFGYDGYYGGSYYDSRYRDLYYNPSYTNISVNLWIFINHNHYGHDNYSDYYLDRDYVRNAFERRIVKISSKSVEKATFERIVKQKVNEVPVQVREMETDNRKVKVVVPIGTQEHVRKNANRVVKEVIAPVFAEKDKPFKGLNSKNAKIVTQIFKQENVKPRVEKFSTDVFIRHAEEAKENREERRVKIVNREIEEVVRIEKERKVHEPKNEKEVKDLEKQQIQRPQADRDRQFEQERKEEPSRKYDHHDPGTYQQKQKKTDTPEPEPWFKHSEKEYKNESGSTDVYEEHPAKEKNRDSQFESDTPRKEEASVEEEQQVKKKVDAEAEEEEESKQKAKEKGKDDKEKEKEKNRENNEKSHRKGRFY